MDGAAAEYDGDLPAVAAGGGHFLISWQGDDDTIEIGNGDQELEIFAQPTLAPGLIFADGFESGVLCDGRWLVVPAQCLSE